MQNLLVRVCGNMYRTYKICTFISEWALFVHGTCNSWLRII
jgi:hypothetical protein